MRFSCGGDVISFFYFAFFFLHTDTTISVNDTNDKVLYSAYSNSVERRKFPSYSYRVKGQGRHDLVSIVSRRRKPNSVHMLSPESISTSKSAWTHSPPKWWGNNYFFHRSLSLLINFFTLDSFSEIMISCVAHFSLFLLGHALDWTDRLTLIRVRLSSWCRRLLIVFYPAFSRYIFKWYRHGFRRRDANARHAGERYGGYASKLSI